MSSLYPEPQRVASVSLTPGLEGSGGVSKSPLLPQWQVEYFMFFSSCVSGFLLPAKYVSANACAQDAARIAKIFIETVVFIDGAYK